MSWLYLVLAGLFEIGWPVGLKIAQESTTRWSGILIAVVFMVLSGFLLWLAQLLTRTEKYPDFEVSAR